ncbi:sperm flagellar protein 2 [Myripristis murdjan]|uniref:sperm flagellar protein 2 n=1 Tax=Myripristis murdjan TaxID=586833 RepID=UPI001175FEE4|nr:sperm flagellar protein 2 [Myripristis murdjan]
MSEILCKWLNKELRLSKSVEPNTISKDFASGYLIGEVLHKYQLQDDFSLFTRNNTSNSKLNNFARIKPTLQLLGVPFDLTTAQALMQEQQGATTRFLYQLYISLEKKKKAGISAAVMEISQPAAAACLHKKENEIYADRLHMVVKRDADLKLEKISQRYEDRTQQWNDKSAMAQLVQQQKQLKVQEEMRMKNIEKLRASRQRQNEVMARIQASIVQVPKPPPNRLLQNLEKRRQQQRHREQQAQIVQAEIAQVEKNKKTLITSGFGSSSSSQTLPGDSCTWGSSHGRKVLGGGPEVVLQSNSEYIQRIHQRLEEDAMARQQRDKRRRQFLVEQFKAHEAQEEAKREEQLVKRLTRQTQQERRLEVQLLQIRKQKEVIRENRLFREQQYQQRRERDFQEALEREAALARQAKLDQAEEIRKELEHYNRIAAERAENRYKKHFKSCREILEQIVDLATKVGEYRLFTGNLIPVKMMREWKELLFCGLPQYEPVTEGQQPGFKSSAPIDSVELEKQETLNNQDYDEYTNMVGNWAWPEEAGETKCPPTKNRILGHIILRLRNIAHPPTPDSPSPSFTHFTLKACVLGKQYSGKTTCLARIAEAHGICVLSADILIQEALMAYQNGEELSTRAQLGAAAEKELRKCKSVPNELMVDIMVEAIRQIPAYSGWILDGFPMNITQAVLLEKALGGSGDLQGRAVSSRTNLAIEPNATKMPQPPAPVLDVALLLDISDEHVIVRAVQQTSEESGPEERSAPNSIQDPVTITTAGTATSSGGAVVATAFSPRNKTLEKAQIQHSIIAFQDTWSKLEKWFGRKQNILVRVDADVEEEELYKKVESVLQHVMMQRQKAVFTPPVDDVVLDSGKARDTCSSATPPHADQVPGLTESSSSLNQETALSSKSCTQSNTLSSRGHSRKMSVCSVSNETSQEVLKSPSESGPPHPHSVSWVYVDEHLPAEIAAYLCPYWDKVCESYVSNIKTVMQDLRSERNLIIHHLFNTREEFKHYLSRPDLKQEFVSQWQRDYNSIPEDMRGDDDTRAELHQRLDDLRECLWDICDKRKEENEQERAALMGNRWLEDHTAVLINDYSALMQVEVDRFQNTLCILRDYYGGMCRHAVPDPPTDLICIPLVDITDTEDQEESSEQTTGDASGGTDDGEEKSKTKVILLPRHIPSIEEVSMPNDQQEADSEKPPDEILISNIYEAALLAINSLVSQETQKSEVEINEENLTQQEKEKTEKTPRASASERTKNKNKIQKEARSKSVERQADPSPPRQPSPAPETKKRRNSEIHKQDNRTKIQKEYDAAREHEEHAVKARLELVRGCALVTVRSLQRTTEQTFSSLKKWLEAHYLAEMKNIDQLTEVVRHHIESDAKLQNELVLECTDFYVDGDLRLVASPPPPPRPSAMEKPTNSSLTIAQLEALYQQLCKVAPSGLMSSFDFTNTLQNIISVNMCSRSLPESWISMTESQLMEIISLLTHDAEMLDWHRFLLSAALPWPIPSLTQLLSVLRRFQGLDTHSSGYINEQQYLQTELWFPSETVQPVPEDPSEPLPYDRLANLRKFFFQLFADHSVSPPRLEYVSMLQYFSAHPDSAQGFVRALSVVVGQHLKHSSTTHLVKSMPNIKEAGTPELEGEHTEGDGEETACGSSSLLGEQGVSIPALLDVICCKGTKMEGYNHFAQGCNSQEEHTENLVRIFGELGYRPEEHIPFSVLSQHPFIQGLVDSSTYYKLIDIYQLLHIHKDEGEFQRLTVS